MQQTTWLRRILEQIAVAAMDGTPIMPIMPAFGNIVIADESAFHLLMHDDAATRIRCSEVIGNPLADCAEGAFELAGFNSGHPLYGAEPVKLLVPNAGLRRANRRFVCRYSGCDFPRGSFFNLRDNLYAASPELVFARMANYLTTIKLIEVGYALCARYYIDPNGKVRRRSGFLTSPEKLVSYLELAVDLRGRCKAMQAARYVKANSGSPMETKSAILFCLPPKMGGFGLPFNALNYDVQAGRNRALAEQDDYCVDLANPTIRFAAEFDGREYHLDSGKDKRRRNALTALGWTVFAYEKDVLFDPVLTEKLAYQMAKRMSFSIEPRKGWDDAYIALRRDLDLPV